MERERADKDLKFSSTLHLFSLVLFQRVCPHRCVSGLQLFDYVDIVVADVYSRLNFIMSPSQLIFVVPSLLPGGGGMRTSVSTGSTLAQKS